MRQKYTLSLLRRRARTIATKAEELHSLAMRNFGADDYATTMTDNLVIAAEDACETLESRALAQQEKDRTDG